MATVSAGETPFRRSRQQPLELIGRQETPVVAQVGAERMVDRAGNVAGDRVDGLDGAGESLGRAPIHQ